MADKQQQQPGVRETLQDVPEGQQQHPQPAPSSHKLLGPLSKPAAAAASPNPSTSAAVTSFALSNASTAGNGLQNRRDASSTLNFYGTHTHSNGDAPVSSASPRGQHQNIMAVPKDDDRMRRDAAGTGAAATTITKAPVPEAAGGGGKMQKNKKKKQRAPTAKNVQRQQQGDSLMESSASNFRASTEASDDAPREQARRQSAAAGVSSAMARDTSNTSVASTRSLPARATRASKRKYVEEDSSIDEDSLEEEPFRPSAKQKGKARQVPELANDESNPSLSRSRSTSSEVTAGESKVNGINQTSRSATGLSIRLKTGTSKQGTTPSSSASKSKRRKRRIEESDENTPYLPRSRLHSEAFSQASIEDGESRPSQLDILKDEAASTSDSSVSTPLASSFRGGHSMPASEHIPLAHEIEAKSEPVSEAEDGKEPSASTRAGSATSLPNGSRAPTITTSRANSAEVDARDYAAPSSRASASSEPVDLLLPPSNRSVSAMDGGDELSTGAQTTAMPSPAGEFDKQLGEVKKSIPAAPPTKKRRGRPPKKRLLSETPGPGSGTILFPISALTRLSDARLLFLLGDTQDVGSATPAAEPVLLGIKARYQATLKNERELIAAGTHPLFLQALVDYDKLRMEKIAVLDTILHAKEEAWRKTLEARENSLWETWQDDRRKLWYDMTLTYSKQQRQLVFEKDTMEAEAIDPSKFADFVAMCVLLMPSLLRSAKVGLFGTAKSILWPERDATCSFVNPPVVDPLIRVPIAAKPPLKGRTRSSAKAPIQTGEALVAPLNTKVAQGISALSKDEIDLDLEVMGLSKHKLEENWFYNSIIPEEGMEVDDVKSEPMRHASIREMPVEDDFLLPKADPSAQAQASYPYAAPLYDYTAWPPYPDPRYPTGPPYNPYYPVPPYPSTSAAEAAFHFPTGPTPQDHPARERQKAFSFPKSNRSSFNGKAGNTKDDAILIDDEGLPIPVNGAGRAAEARRDGRMRMEEPSLRSAQKPKREYSAHELDRMRVADLQRTRLPPDDYHYAHRYPENAYAADRRSEAWGPAEDYRYASHAMGGSPDPILVGSPPGREAHSHRGRRVSSGEREQRYTGSEAWSQQHPRYQPYYDASRVPGPLLDDPTAQNGYPGDFYVDPWGRPVDPYHAPPYFHPAYAEQDSRYSSRGEHPLPPEHYRDDHRGRYRQYSAQSDDPYHPTYAPPYPPYPQEVLHDQHRSERGGYTASSSRLAKSPERERLPPAGYPANYPAEHR